jgi:ParB family chromosome partitioning protein
VLAVSLDRIRANPSQPRRHFDEAQLSALAASLRERGALQPIVVRPAEGGYELVAGERRLRAARLAGLAEIPAIVRVVRDDEMLELALIENVQREDLNPIERARAYRTLQERHGLSDEAIGAKMGEDRSTVSNYIRLLNLAPDVVDLIAGNQLSTGHGKALLGCPDPKRQSGLAGQAIREGWPVRRLEAAVRLGAARNTGRGQREVRPAVRDMEQRLTAAVGTRASIREGRRKGAGTITIEYYSLNDFERITGLLGVDPEGA